MVCLKEIPNKRTKTFRNGIVDNSTTGKNVTAPI